MKQILRAFLFLLLFTATVNTAIADEKANVTKQGTVRGRIIDATKQTLPGASIYIEKLHTGVTSDVNGFYTFSNLDPGTYTVKVSYVGYSPVELKITIPAGRTLEKDVVLNEGVELQEVVVGGAFQGQRRAINSQKNNMGITNVVSADQVGKFPDSNIGDALKRISGINVQYDQGEARFVYKFSIAFENAWYPGYTSEKIVTSMLAGTIPIYWGNPDISREFNSASFINCHDFPTLDDAAAYVKKVDEDDNLWCEIMSRPWKTPEQEARFLEETERETAKLYKIFDQSPEEARRKGDGTWVSYYHRFLKRGHRMQLAWRRLKNRLRR